MRALFATVRLTTLASLLLGLVSAPVVFAAPATTNPNADREGMELAKQLRGMTPSTNLSVNVVLRIIPSKGKRRALPVKFETQVTDEHWRSIYSVAATNDSPAARLEILRAPDQPTIYKFDSKELRGTEAMIPLAGSDFWLAELGMEFLHWPEQRLLKREIRHSQSCFVLESSTLKSTNGYTRVVSWIDIDTGGIVHANAYDAEGREIKEFRPRKFQKVEGRWEIKELWIKDERTGSQSILEFNFSAPEKSL